MSLSVHIEKDLGDFHLRADLETTGGVFGVLGASGCGKSYTLKCIAGIETPDRGSIVLEGVTLFDAAKGVNLRPQQRQVGYLFQNYALFPNMNVRKNILCGMHRERNRAQRQRRLDEVAAMFQLEGLMEHRPYQLSGGQAQRVALARILVNQPRLLMLDEPFSALDSYLRTKLQWEMQEVLSRFGQDVLLVTHDRDEAYRFCPQMVIMDQGHVVAGGSREAVFDHPQTAAAAAITGCKNLSPAQKNGPYTLYARDWETTLTAAEPVGEDVAAVGLRAHFFTPVEGPGENVFPLTDPHVNEAPFSVSVYFQAGSARIRWEIDRSRWAEYQGKLPRYLRIAPEGVMALR